MGAPMSPDGRRVLPWPAMPARWCTRVHAPWRGGGAAEGTEASGAGVPKQGFYMLGCLDCQDNFKCRGHVPNR